MNHRLSYFLLIILALLQAPLIYYYTSGPTGMLVLAGYGLTGLILTWNYLRKNFKKSTLFEKIQMVIIPLLGTSTLVLSESGMELLDWELRKRTRQDIVTKIQEGKQLNLPSYFPPISNWDNDIKIEKHSDSELTVQFYIDRGYMENYDAFVFTNHEPKQTELENMSALDNKRTWKLEKNWYRASY